MCVKIYVLVTIFRVIVLLWCLDEVQEKMMIYNKGYLEELFWQNEEGVKGFRKVGMLEWICFIRVENLSVNYVF